MAKRKTEPKPEPAKSRVNVTLDEDIQALIDKHAGRARVTTRDPSGHRKILTATFGPRSAPSHLLEVQDFGSPEDPCSRERRLHEARVRRHDARRLEIEEAVTKALKKQREQLTGKDPDVITPVAPVPDFDQERFSKASFTQAIAALLTADDCPIPNMVINPIIEKGKNQIEITIGDQNFLLNCSMPRKPKEKTAPKPAAKAKTTRKRKAKK